MSESDRLVRSLVRQLERKLEGIPNDKIEPTLDAFFEDDMRDCDEATVHAVLDLWRNHFEAARAEDEDEHRRDKAHTEMCLRIFAGLPETTTFREACTLKAAQGDPEAKRELARLDTRAHRLHAALVDAAVDAHPGWRHDGTYLQRIDDSAPDLDALVEWFQKNHPLKARAIEHMIEDKP
jgi:hypothetical protein